MNSIQHGAGFVRPAAAAGRFYPANPEQLRQDIETLLASVPASPGPAPKALIVPHAGYIYSGPIAASAYAQLIPERAALRRVVLVGPAHFAEFAGIAASGAESFATPLGRVRVEREAVQRLTALGMVTVFDAAHAPEHSLEVQLPFLQVVLDDFSLVPLLIGEASPEQVSRVLEALWGGPETVLVISSDLSHYLEHDAAVRLDTSTAQTIERLDAGALTGAQACGLDPIRGLLQAAAAHHLVGRTLDLRNSGDTGGPRQRVVGYGAFAFRETA